MGIDRADVGLVLGIAGVLLGGASFYYSFRQDIRHREVVQPVLDFDRDTLEDLVDAKTATQSDVAEANKRVSSLRKELTDGMNEVATLRSEAAALRERIAFLRKRVDALDGGRPEPPQPQPEGPTLPTAPPKDGGK